MGNQRSDPHLAARRPRSVAAGRGSLGSCERSPEQKRDPAGTLAGAQPGVTPWWRMTESVDDPQRDDFVRERPVFVSLMDHRTFQPVESCYEPEVVALVAREMLKRRPDYPTDSVLWRKEL